MKFSISSIAFAFAFLAGISGTSAAGLGRIPIKGEKFIGGSHKPSAQRNLVDKLQTMKRDRNKPKPRSSNSVQPPEQMIKIQVKQK